MACSAISVSWSAMARLSLAVCARFALTCSETMIDSCGRLRIVSSSGHGVLSKPTTLPANSQTTMPVVMPMNTHIEPQNLFTTSAILSRMLVRATGRHHQLRLVLLGRAADLLSPAVHRGQRLVDLPDRGAIGLRLAQGR